MPNRLTHEHSPYLLQHQHNPVDWYPWGEEAFARARAEDRPIFLSIGYATCHWCHVMERESFEDEAVARLMNETFVSIKVDREERPDVDGVYMAVCQMVTGHGGWPLTIVMTPEGRPFYAATYLPKHSRHGRIGMLDLVPRIGEIWRTRRAEVEGSAEEMTAMLQRAAAVAPEGATLDAGTLTRALEQFKQRYDPAEGGFGSAPKFPTPHNLLLLLRLWRRTKDDAALEMVTHTLTRMRMGGIYDHVGYGFHRYATDAHWRLPHFEKMLYDQALLALAYTEAFQATGRPDFEQTAREIFTYVFRDMTAPEGAFYAAEDADSEGREGKFYVWTLDEVRAVLDDEAAELVARVYNLEAEGNFLEEATREKTGENVLYLARTLAAVAADLGMDPGALQQRLDGARGALFARRVDRVRPGLDDKVLTDWNGLMIAALARAARTFGEPAYAASARRAADFLLGTLRTDGGRLLHRYRQGEAGIRAHVDDYSFLIWGLLELYETTFDAELLESARALNDHLLRHYWDDAAGALFFTPDDGEALIVRQKEAYDGAVPSGNSVAMLNLLRLSRITGDTDLADRADRIAAWAAAQVQRMPSAFSALLMGVDFAVGPSYEVVVVGDEGAPDVARLLEALHGAYVPNKVVLFRPAGEAAPAVARVAPFVAEHTALAGEATAYVCRDYRCNRPTTDPAAMLAQLDARPSVRPDA